MNIIFIILVPIVIGVLLGFTVESKILVYIISFSYALLLGIGSGYINKKRVRNNKSVMDTDLKLKSNRNK